MNIAIDGQKLKQIMVNGFFNQAEVSRAIGYNSDYISQCINKCSMSQHAARELKKIYDIDSSEFSTGTNAVEPRPQASKTRSTKQIEVDGQKLLQIIREKNISAHEISRNMGYSQSYISMCASTGQISQTALKLLELMYDIKIDDIKKQEKPKAFVKTSEPDSKAIEKRIDALSDSISRLETDMFMIFKSLKGLEDYKPCFEETLEKTRINGVLLRKLLEELGVTDENVQKGAETDV